MPPKPKKGNKDGDKPKPVHNDAQKKKQHSPGGKFNAKVGGVVGMGGGMAIGASLGGDMLAHHLAPYVGDEHARGAGQLVGGMVGGLVGGMLGALAGSRVKQSDAQEAQRDQSHERRDDGGDVEQKHHQPKKDDKPQDDKPKDDKPKKGKPKQQQQQAPAEEQEERDEDKSAGEQAFRDAQARHTRTSQDFEESLAAFQALSQRSNDLPEELFLEAGGIDAAIKALMRQDPEELGADGLEARSTTMEVLAQQITDLSNRAAETERAKPKKSDKPPKASSSERPSEDEQKGKKPAKKPPPKADDEEQGDDDEKEVRWRTGRRLTEEEYDQISTLLLPYDSSTANLAADKALLGVLRAKALRDLKLPEQEALRALLAKGPFKDLIQIVGNRFVIADKEAVRAIAQEILGNKAHPYHRDLCRELDRSVSDEDDSSYALTYKAMANIAAPDTALMRRLMDDPSQINALSEGDLIQAVWFLAGGWAEAARHPAWRAMFNMTLELHESGAFEQGDAQLSIEGFYRLMEFFPPQTQQAVLAMNRFNREMTGQPPPARTASDANYNEYIHRSAYLFRNWTLVTLAQAGVLQQGDIDAPNWPALFTRALAIAEKDPKFLGVTK